MKVAQIVKKDYYLGNEYTTNMHIKQKQVRYFIYYYLYRAGFDRLDPEEWSQRTRNWKKNTELHDASRIRKAVQGKTR